MRRLLGNSAGVSSRPLHIVARVPGLRSTRVNVVSKDLEQEMNIAVHGGPQHAPTEEAIPLDHKAADIAAAKIAERRAQRNREQVRSLAPPE